MNCQEDGEAAASSAPVAYGPDDRLVIPFQNENLYACLERPDGGQKVSGVDSSSDAQYQAAYGHMV